MKRLILLFTILFAGLDRVPAGREVQLTIENQQGRLAIRNQDGRGVLFYRGLEEVQEWLHTKTEGWESDLQYAIKAQRSVDSTLGQVRKTFRIYDPRIEAQAIGLLSRSGLFRLGYSGITSTLTFQIDSAFTYETSGDGAIYLFNSPITQSNAALTLYVYCTAATGTPSSSSLVIYNSQTSTSGDAQRPPAGASPLATSSNTSAAGCTSASWLTYSIASVSLTAGNTYFAIIKNDTADPTNNHFTVTTRGSGGFQSGGASAFSSVATFRALTTTDGIVTDPVGASGVTSQGHGVFKFSDGTIAGNPYVASSGSTSNTNYRGTRVTFDEDIVLGGVDTSSHTITLTTVASLEIYQGAAQQKSVTIDVYGKGNGVSHLFAPITLTGGTAYDIVLKLETAGTTGTYLTMGNSPPADVQTSGNGFSYVNGATPGSFTETTNRIMPMVFVIDTNPTQAGGTATGRILGN